MTDSGIEPSLSPVVGAMLRSARDFLTHEHSLFRTLGLKPVLIGRGRTTFSLDLPADFADEAGFVHGGLHTIILDSIMGLTVFTSLDELKPIATINLRTDHLTTARAGTRAICACETTAIVGEIAYVSGRLTAEATGALIANAVGAFMVGTKGQVKGSRL